MSKINIDEVEKVYRSYGLEIKTPNYKCINGVLYNPGLVNNIPTAFKIHESSFSNTTNLKQNSLK